LTHAHGRWEVGADGYTATMSAGRRRLVVLSLLAAVAIYAWIATRLERRAIAAQSAAVAAPAEVEQRVNAAELMTVVSELASPKYAGRRTGTSGGRAARAFVRRAFAGLGLGSQGTSGFEQPFQFTHSSVRGFLLPGRAWRTDYEDAANVIGAVEGIIPTNRAIVVTAHYDHLGVRDGVTYPGADDNASGVAALLAIARHVRAHPLRHDVLFVAFDAEELGLAGAKAFVAHPPRPIPAMALNVNLDMVSRSDRNEIFAAGSYHAPWLKPLLEDVQRRSAVKVLLGHDRPAATAGTVDDWTHQSDHGALHEAGVPFVYFGVEDHPDYHEPTDTPEKINPTFFRNVVEMVLDAVITLDRSIPIR
jgi:Zn-dependent M28 family amino/carboxypeptidase